MSDTMSASGTQTLEPRPGLSDRAPATESPSGTYSMQNQDGVSWASVTIAQDTTSNVWTLSTESETPFSGTTTLANVSFLHVQFTSDADLDESVYATLIDDMITLTYVKNPPDRTIEPVATGVWLGTSTGGQLNRRIDA